jgi:hypothetical protein
MLLAVVYATLAVAGNALHQHSPPSPTESEASHSCGHCCCLHDLLAAKTKVAGEVGFSSQQDLHNSEHCLACQVLAQMKLGQASLPPAVILRVQASERETFVEIAELRRTILWIATRGPPVATATVA